LPPVGVQPHSGRAVGLTTEELCTAYKDKVPVIPDEERAAIVGAIRWVDEVIPQPSMDRWQVWEDRHFDLTVVGDDWQGSALWDEYERRFCQVGVKIVYLPYTGHTSSSLLPSVLHRLSGAA
jgi:glycerol-3-phosphate cytidylyltransferase